MTTSHSITFHSPSAGGLSRHRRKALVGRIKEPVQSRLVAPSVHGAGDTQTLKVVTHQGYEIPHAKHPENVLDFGDLPLFATQV